MNAALPLFDSADGQMSAHPKARTHADRARTEALIEKAVEDDILVREWRRWRQEEVTQALAGPHGTALAELLATLKAAPNWKAINSGRLLAPWQDADRDIRALVRRAVNAFVASKREAAKLPPWDDDIPSFEGGAL